MRLTEIELYKQKQKVKARLLRKSAWWRQKCKEGTCYYCKQSFPPKELTMDHIIPISRGGSSDKLNLVPACHECNQVKNNRIPFEWESYIKEKAIRAQNALNKDL